MALRWDHCQQQVRHRRDVERAGILTWCNRIKRVREYVPGLFGKASALRWGVQREALRTSPSRRRAP